MKTKIILFCILIFLFCSCRKKPVDGRSFCYWKTRSYFTKTDDSLIKQLGVNHFYTRFFDVDWNPYENEALPVETLRDYYGEIPVIKFTPSIFITNAVFEHTEKNQLDTLARKIRIRIENIITGLSKNYADKCMDSIRSRKEKEFENNHNSEETSQLMETINQSRDSVFTMSKELYNKLYDEILIDCDWTVKTRDNYFYFLKQIKKEFKDRDISVTLRLWQFKYREKAGIPPVDRCLLMCYSMESPMGYETTNSICTKKDLSAYITSGSYKLPVDIALPVFSWAVLFRGGKFIGLISKANINNYTSDSVAFEKINTNRFIIQADTIIDNYYYRYGDEIRVEEVNPDELEKICRFLKRKFDARRITFFSWDTVYIKRYGIENLTKYYRILGN